MSEQKQHIDEKHLTRFLLGESSQQEILDINAWLEVSEANQKLMDQVESLWVEMGKLKPQPVPVDTKLAWSNMSQKIDTYQEPNKTKTLPLRKIITSLAAAIVLAFGVFHLFNDQFKSFTPIELASNDQIINKKLSDGSDIALNLNTTITYPKRFGKEQRLVKLKGEAFFDIERNPK
jgi:ferric-dicitrate binding protein FerR (iron transport regulator)